MTLNLICSIVYASTTKIDHVGFYMGKIKIYFFLFLETIAALGPKLLETFSYMSLWSWVSVKGQGHSLALVKGLSDFKVKTCFSQKQLGHLEPKLI